MTQNLLWDDTPLFTENEIEQMLEDSEWLCEESEDKKCECGAEKCGSPRHSSYCPKYER